jgi:putative DNA primase/helicase
MTKLYHADTATAIDYELQTNNLTQADIDKLERSFIPPDMAASARLFRVTSPEGALIVGRGKGNYAGIVFPYYWPGETKPREYRLRRDNPDIEYKNGQPTEKDKYLSPVGRGNKLYFPPGTDPTCLSDSTTPGVICEGEKKTLALHRMFSEAGRKVLVIGLPGVYGWRGKIGIEPGPDGSKRDVKGPIDDLNHIVWQGREVSIIFDANVATNPMVKAARRKLAQELSQRRASVKYVDTPAVDGVNGPDDLLGLWGPARVLELFASARSSEGDLTGFNRTEVGNAEAFAYLYGHKVRYDYKRGRWLLWLDHWWITENDGELQRLAIKAARELYAQAPTIADLSERQSVATWAIKSESRKSIENRLAITKALFPIADKGDDWDSDPWLFGAGNGVVDLRAGELRAGAPSDRITLHTDVCFDERAECPLWLSFLDRIMASNADLIAFLQRAIGYSLTGRIDEQCLFFLYGGGANGKSTLINTILQMMGRYGRQCAPALLIVQHNDQHPAGLADAATSRFLATIEVDDGKRLAEGLVKQMTGGDRLKARFMRENFFEFESTFKVWLAANHKPTIKGTDHAIWRRIKLIPFDVQIPEPERDKDLADKLATELPGILNWAIKGCLEWQRIGLAEPEEIKKATAAYRAEMDIIADFLEECCDIEAGLMVSAKALFNAYKRWAEAAGETAVNQKKFGGQLTERGFTREKKRDGWVWNGLSVKSEM